MKVKFIKKDLPNGGVLFGRTLTILVGRAVTCNDLNAVDESITFDLPDNTDQGTIAAIKEKYQAEIIQN
jgi:hypothetical protein